LFLHRQLRDHRPAEPLALGFRVLAQHFDDLFTAPPSAIQQHLGRFHPKLWSRARRLADAIPAVFAWQRERLTPHHGKEEVDHLAAIFADLSDLDREFDLVDADAAYVSRLARSILIRERDWRALSGITTIQDAMDRNGHA
jgi:hypothetical protein